MTPTPEALPPLPAETPAEKWLRSRYGAYRGHFAWRELEEAFTAGRASIAMGDGEPVAWIRTTDITEIVDSEPESDGWTPLYTAQPAQAWADGYRSGVHDERASEANIGVAGFGMKVEPARENPYRTAATAQPAPAAPAADIDEAQIKLMTERGAVAWAGHEAPAAPAVPAEFDVRTVLLDVAPGDGNGLEVFAKNVDDVVNKLTELAESEDSLRTQVDLLTAAVEARGKRIAQMGERPAPAAPVSDDQILKAWSAVLPQGLQNTADLLKGVRTLLSLCPAPAQPMSEDEVDGVPSHLVPRLIKGVVDNAAMRKAAKQAEPVHVEVVGEVVTTDDGNDVRWSIEGGADAIPEGVVLLISDRPITDDTGGGEVYAHAQPAQPMSEDTARLDWMSTNEAHIGWNREGEVCRVWAVQDEEKGAEPLTGWHNSARAAIDAARGITAQAGEAS